MHVCLISLTVEFGGVEHHQIHLAEYLRELGHQVTLAILGQDVFDVRGRNGDLPFNIIRRRLSTMPSKLSLREARAIVRNLPGDVCIFEKGSYVCGNLWLDVAARLHFGRLITVEQLEAELLPPRTSRRYFKGLIRGPGIWWHKRWINVYARSIAPNRIVCVSDSVKRRLASEYRFPNRKMQTIPNGVDSQKFQRDDNARASARQEWGIADEETVFGAIGRFHTVKRYDVAIRQFARLTRELPSLMAKLVLIGQGHEEAKLRALAAELQVADQVLILPFTNDPRRAINGIDVYLMPSANEGLPFALLEAMACERAVIATDVGGNREIVDETTGWLVPAGDEEAFFRAMYTVANLPTSVLAERGRAARERVKSRFDMRANLKALIEIACV